ncbi:MAG: HD domain-containing protein [Oscillospiraceae bacterium]|nr:HD domain-containing protein [Oscillospiraceae bacterium]
MSFFWESYCKARALAAGASFEETAQYMEHIEDLLTTAQLQSLDGIEHHKDTSLLTHVRCVSYVAYLLCARFGGDCKITSRGGLLHDLYYYDWHDFSDKSHRFHGFRHPTSALKNAQALLGELDKRTANCIKRHMFPFTPLPPVYREAVWVSVADKICASYDVLISRFPRLRRRFEADTKKLKKSATRR